MRIFSFILLFTFTFSLMGFSYTLQNKEDLERIRAFYKEKEADSKNEMEEYRQKILKETGKDVRGFPAGSKEYKHYSKLEQNYWNTNAGT